MSEHPPQRRLGSTGPLISRVGLGGYRLGEGDENVSVEAIRFAIAAGVNWVDTAPAYGDGASERIIGRALADLTGRRPFVFTKCGSRRGANGQLSADLSSTAIRTDCESSLKRLGVDSLDALLIHRPGDVNGIPLESSWAELARIAEEGKARWIGLSNVTVAQLSACEAVRHIDFIQPPLSPIRHEAAADVLPWCDAHGVGVVAYSPMRSGLLTNRFSADRLHELPPTDWRHRNADFMAPRLALNLAVRDELAAIGAGRGLDAGVIAIAWVLAWGSVTGAVVGARSPEQVAGWLGAPKVSLDAEELARIADAISALDGSGTGLMPS